MVFSDIVSLPDFSVLYKKICSLYGSEESENKKSKKLPFISNLHLIILYEIILYKYIKISYSSFKTILLFVTYDSCLTLVYARSMHVFTDTENAKAAYMPVFSCIGYITYINNNKRIKYVSLLWVSANLKIIISSFSNSNFSPCFSCANLSVIPRFLASMYNKKRKTESIILAFLNASSTSSSELCAYLCCSSRTRGSSSKLSPLRGGSFPNADGILHFPGNQLIEYLLSALPQNLRDADPLCAPPDYPAASALTSA